MKQRIVISNLFSIPLDSIVFLAILGIFTPAAMLLMTASKLVATGIVLFWPSDSLDRLAEEPA